MKKSHHSNVGIAISVVSAMTAALLPVAANAAGMHRGNFDSSDGFHLVNIGQGCKQWENKSGDALFRNDNGVSRGFLSNTKCNPNREFDTVIIHGPKPFTLLAIGIGNRRKVWALVPGSDAQMQQVSSGPLESRRPQPASRFTTSSPDFVPN